MCSDPSIFQKGHNEVVCMTALEILARLLGVQSSTTSLQWKGVQQSIIQFRMPGQPNEISSWYVDV